MGIVREPKGVDFVIQSPPLTKEEQKEISEFIKQRKQLAKQKAISNKRATRKPKKQPTED